MSVTLEDVLHTLVSKNAAPSNIGVQLDRLRFGLPTTPDPFRAKDEVESNMLVQAKILRAISDFKHRDEFRAPNAASYGALDRVQRNTSPMLPQGYIAINVLQSYQEWATTSQERALVQVYRYLSIIAPRFVPPPPKNEPDLVMAFRTGKAKRGRQMSAEVYADCLLALGAFLRVWNKQEKSR